jgi:hypothetical protein
LPPLAVGDVVICRSGETAAGLAIAGLAGVVFETRSAHSLVFFSERGASLWVSNRMLRRGKTESEDRPPPIIGLLNRLLPLFDPTAAAVESTAPDRLVIAVHHGPIDIEVIEAVRDLAATALESIQIQPGGMAYMITVLALRPDLANPAAK